MSPCSLLYISFSTELNWLSFSMLHCYVQLSILHCTIQCEFIIEDELKVYFFILFVVLLFTFVRELPSHRNRIFIFRQTLEIQIFQYLSIISPHPINPL